MHTKNSAYVHLICHIVQDNIAFPAIFPDFGMRIPRNAKAVKKMHISIQIKKHALTVQSIGLYGMEINAFLVQLDPIIIQHQEDANCVPQDLPIMKFKEDVPALNKHHFYIKTVLVLIANRHIFGTVKLNLVMPVH